MQIGDVKKTHASTQKFNREIGKIKREKTSRASNPNTITTKVIKAPLSMYFNFLTTKIDINQVRTCFYNQPLDWYLAQIF